MRMSLAKHELYMLRYLQSIAVFSLNKWAVEPDMNNSNRNCMSMYNVWVCISFQLLQSVITKSALFRTVDMYIRSDPSLFPSFSLLLSLVCDICSCIVWKICKICYSLSLITVFCNILYRIFFLFYNYIYIYFICYNYIYNYIILYRII